MKCNFDQKLQCMIQMPLTIDASVENTYPQVTEAAEEFLKDENRLNVLRQYFKQLQALDFEIQEDNTEVSSSSILFWL